MQAKPLRQAGEGGHAHPNPPRRRRGPGPSDGTHRGRAAAAQRRQKEKKQVSRPDRAPHQAVSTFLGQPAPERSAEPPHRPAGTWRAPRLRERVGRGGPSCSWPRRPGMWRLLPAAPKLQGLPYLGRQLRDPTGHIIKNLSLFHLRGLKHCHQPRGTEPIVAVSDQGQCTPERAVAAAVCDVSPGQPPPHA